MSSSRTSSEEPPFILRSLLVFCFLLARRPWEKNRLPLVAVAAVVELVFILGVSCVVCGRGMATVRADADDDGDEGDNDDNDEKDKENESDKALVLAETMAANG